MQTLRTAPRVDTFAALEMPGAAKKRELLFAAGHARQALPEEELMEGGACTRSCLSPASSPCKPCVREAQPDPQWRRPEPA